MTPAYVYWLVAMDQQEQVANRVAHRVAQQPNVPSRRSRASVIHRTLARMRRRAQLGHAVTAQRVPMGCVT